MTGPLFVVPPMTDPTRLPASVVVGAARCLAQGGTILDANIYAHEVFLGAQWLSERRTVLGAKVAQNNPPNTKQEAYAYYRLVKADLFTGRGAWSSPSKTLRTLRDPRVSPAERETLRLDVERCLDVAFAPYHANVRLNDVTAEHSTESTADLCAVAHDPSNPFRAFWDGLLRNDTRFAAKDWIIWLDRDQQLIPFFTLLAKLRDASAPMPRVLLAGPVAVALQQAGTGEALRHVSGVFATVQDALSSLQPVVPSIQPDHVAVALKVLCHGLSPDLTTLTVEAADLPLQDILHTGGADQLRLHLDTPMMLGQIEKHMSGFGVNRLWSATLRFGQVLSDAEAARLSAAGLRCAHFEVKGFAGYPNEDQAAKAIQSNFAAARSAGMQVLASLVYGFPADSPQSFERFVPFLVGCLGQLDRLVGFRLYRVLIGLPQQTHPADNGIASVGKSPAGHDLARSLPFVTQSGFDSANYALAATEALGGLGAQSPHFPSTPLALDNSQFAQDIVATTSEPQKSEHLTNVTESTCIALARDVVIARSALDFSVLDATFRQWMPRPGKALPDVDLSPKQQAVLRNRRSGKINHLAGAMALVLEAVNHPSTVQDVAAKLRLPATKLAAAVTRLAAADLVCILSETAAGTTIDTNESHDAASKNSANKQFESTGKVQ